METGIITGRFIVELNGVKMGEYEIETTGTAESLELDYEVTINDGSKGGPSWTFGLVPKVCDCEPFQSCNKCKQ